MRFDSALETGNKKRNCSRSIWFRFSWKRNKAHHSNSTAKDRFKCWQKQNLPAGAASYNVADGDKKEIQKNSISVHCIKLEYVPEVQFKKNCNVSWNSLHLHCMYNWSCSKLLLIGDTNTGAKDSLLPAHILPHIMQRERKRETRVKPKRTKPQRQSKQTVTDKIFKHISLYSHKVSALVMWPICELWLPLSVVLNPQLTNAFAKLETLQASTRPLFYHLSNLIVFTMVDTRTWISL